MAVFYNLAIALIYRSAKGETAPCGFKAKGQPLFEIMADSDPHHIYAKPLTLPLCDRTFKISILKSQVYKLQFICTLLLKGQCHEIFCFWFFS